MTAYKFEGRRIDPQKYPWGYLAQEDGAVASLYGKVFLAPQKKSMATLASLYTGAIKSQTTNI